ncbi:delta(12)-fatty-acid desaturase FAD2-like [Wolffia australiana]
MGAGGRLFTEEPNRIISLSRTKLPESTPTHRFPSQKPPFTLGDIKRSVPSHCFSRSVIRSLSHLARDLTLCTGLVYFAVALIPLFPPYLHTILWAFYVLSQGTVLTAIWILGHECGHNAFSPYPSMDDSVGLVLHSALLIPYFSWKYSHRHHHTHTNNIELDEVWVPKTKSKLSPMAKYQKNPLGRIIGWLVALTLGWPLYLAFNIESRFYDRFASHYDPYGPIFRNSERTQVIVSDVAVLAMAGLLIKLCAVFSPAAIVGLYVLPWMVANAFIVVTSYLQHTHPSLPHYDSSDWEWLKGALGTVDRDFGVVLNWILHDFTNTHVAHHLFPKLPHYHAVEATKAIRPVIGEYYQYDRTPIIKAMWREANECLFVESDPRSGKTGVFWFSNQL